MPKTYYYWDDTFRTPEGLSLTECLQKYGTGEQDLQALLRYVVIFLDESKSFGNSWMLRCYRKSNKKNVPVTAYEQHKVYDTKMEHPGLPY